MQKALLAKGGENTFQSGGYCRLSDYYLIFNRLRWKQLEVRSCLPVKFQHIPQEGFQDIPHLFLC
jgi:hypothetical protein